MGIEAIVSRLTPPANPAEISDINWNETELKIGVSFPNDYKEVIATYGTGVIGEFLWILNPFSNNPNLNIDAMLYFQSSYQHMKEQFPNDYQRPKLPKTNSFLTWAVTDNGDSFFWVVQEEDPNEWKVGLHSSDQSEEELTEFNTVGFFVALLDRQLKSNLLPQEFLSTQKKFRATH